MSQKLAEEDRASKPKLFTDIACSTVSNSLEMLKQHVSPVFSSLPSMSRTNSLSLAADLSPSSSRLLRIVEGESVPLQDLLRINPFDADFRRAAERIRTNPHLLNTAVSSQTQGGDEPLNTPVIPHPVCLDSLTYNDSVKVEPRSPHLPRIRCELPTNATEDGDALSEMPLDMRSPVLSALTSSLISLSSSTGNKVSGLSPQPVTSSGIVSPDKITALESRPWRHLPVNIDTTRRSTELTQFDPVKNGSDDTNSESGRAVTSSVGSLTGHGSMQRALPPLQSVYSALPSVVSAISSAPSTSLGQSTRSLPLKSSGSVIKYSPSSFSAQQHAEEGQRLVGEAGSISCPAAGGVAGSVLEAGRLHTSDTSAGFPTIGMKRGLKPCTPSPPIVPYFVDTDYHSLDPEPLTSGRSRGQGGRSRSRSNARQSERNSESPTSSISQIERAEQDRKARNRAASNRWRAKKKRVECQLMDSLKQLKQTVHVLQSENSRLRVQTLEYQQLLQQHVAQCGLQLSLPAAQLSTAAAASETAGDRQRC